MKVWVVLFGLIVVLATEARAAGFNLKSISQVNTDGKQISHWWYSGTLPAFHGEAASPGAEVIIDVDGTAQQINADSAGNWDWQPPADLSEGDHQITLTSGGSVIKFTLTLGVNNVDWQAVESGSGGVLPTVGFILPTWWLATMGVGAVLWGGKMVFNADKK